MDIASQGSCFEFAFSRHLHEVQSSHNECAHNKKATSMGRLLLLADDSLFLVPT